jgi:hypothetical protein
MGIEAVRSSTPQACRTSIKECLKVIMTKDEDAVIEFIAQFKEKFTNSGLSLLAPAGRGWSRTPIFEKRLLGHVNNSLAGKGCEQIKNAVLNAATLSEPVWYAALSIAWHCVDRDEAIHLLSEDHPEYDREKTDLKAKQTDGKPQSCAQFNNINPGV